jgi:hypothetical protein
MAGNFLTVASPFTEMYCTIIFLASCEIVIVLLLKLVTWFKFLKWVMQILNSWPNLEWDSPSFLLHAHEYWDAFHNYLLLVFRDITALS